MPFQQEGSGKRGSSVSRFTRRARRPVAPDAAYAVSAVWAWWCLASVRSDIHRTGLGPQLRRGVEQCYVTPWQYLRTSHLN